ncbi:HAMP domain-containing sensor histidine kinase [Alkalinema sp. FACHB-956]|uniref:sensor histidine kinase n=1 Tax=Alkalinema sp. FACHB-956 TaxID=2692768 RepID=UPI00321FEB66
MGLTLGLVVVALPLMQQRVFSKVDARVREDLEEEVEDFNRILRGDLDEADRRELENIVEDGRPPFTTRPQTKREVETIFELYLNRRVPEDDTFLIAIINGEFYKSSPRALPTTLDPQQGLVKGWSSLKNFKRGKLEHHDSALGSLKYMIQPVVVDGNVMGLLVVVHGVNGERQEAIEALSGVIQVLGGLLFLVLAIAWWLSGKLLSPLRDLVNTAHQISEADLSARLPVDGNGEIAELATTFNDMMDRLESAFATQRNFINDAGHELRTPLTIVQGHLELMGNDPMEQSETLALVNDELDRMGRLVNDLILLTKAERPDFLQPEQVDLRILTEELLTKATALGDRNWQLDRVAQGSAFLDRQRMTEAVMNLAQNAVQHTEPGAVIAIGSSHNGRSLRIWVRDTGEGVSTEDQQRIFERFARAARSRRRSEGSGLGLAIVRAIAEAHHGEVHLVSQIGQGATFMIVVPILASVTSSPIRKRQL